MSKVIDCVSYNGEQDLLEIHLKVLNDYVDQFIILEAPTTFTGLPKPLYYKQHQDRFREFQPKIKFFVIDENYSSEEIALSEASPNTRGATHWKHEFLQKESIKKALTHLEDNDICFIGDIDEIWMPEALTLDGVFKLKLKVYSYYLNNRSTEEFWGTLKAPYVVIKETVLNHLRTTVSKTCEDFGWHFTSMGGLEEIKRKLESSYTEDSYLTPWVIDNLERNLAINRDFLGRGFRYWLDESNWPQYLKDNRGRYKHLIK